MNVFGIVVAGGVVCFVIVCGGGGGCTHGIVIPMNESAVSITHRNCKKVFSLPFMVVVVVVVVGFQN